MGDLLICGRSLDDDMGGRMSRALQDAARGEGLVVQTLTPLVWMAASGPRPPQAVAAGAWTLIGDAVSYTHLPSPRD